MLKQVVGYFLLFWIRKIVNLKANLIKSFLSSREKFPNVVLQNTSVQNDTLHFQRKKCPFKSEYIIKFSFSLEGATEKVYDIFLQQFCNIKWEQDSLTYHFSNSWMLFLFYEHKNVDTIHVSFIFFSSEFHFAHFFCGAPPPHMVLLQLCLAPCSIES